MDYLQVEPQVDRVERMRGEFPGVNFIAVVSGNDRAEVERIATRRRWTLPIAVDQDGWVISLYGVALCPTTVFARAGGRVQQTKLGNLTEDELRRAVTRLTRDQNGSERTHSHLVESPTPQPHILRGNGVWTGARVTDYRSACPKPG